jgi:hypothetical protein
MGTDVGGGVAEEAEEEEGHLDVGKGHGGEVGEARSDEGRHEGDRHLRAQLGDLTEQVAQLLHTPYNIQSVERADMGVVQIRKIDLIIIYF